MADRAESKVAGVLGSYLLRRMGNQPYLGYGRYVWGAIYTTLCPLARWWMWFVVPSALVLLACGYLGRCFTWVFVIALSWLLALLVRVPSRPPVFVPGGRRAMFRATLALVVTVVAAISLYVIALILGSVILSALIPRIMV